jgi:nitrogenase molybdenum-iron protein alpha chain
MTKKDDTNGLPDPSFLKEEILAKYPRKVAKKRAKAMVVNDPGQVQEIAANIRTIPGIITQRGCTYAGCKGVVLGPTPVSYTHLTLPTTPYV